MLSGHLKVEERRFENECYRTKMLAFWIAAPPVRGKGKLARVHFEDFKFPHERLKEKKRKKFKPLSKAQAADLAKKWGLK